MIKQNPVSAPSPTKPTAQSSSSTLSLGVLIYGSNAYKRKGIARWAAQLGAHDLCLVNNHSASLQPDELAGTNQFYEFSGYHQLCQQLQGPGPFVILNDTLWVNRWVGGWRRLVQAALSQNLPPGFYGDIRVEAESIVERPNRYLASWIFVLPDREHLHQLRSVLESVMQENYPPPSAAYADYLSRWLQPRWYRGWHGALDSTALARKKQSIRMEHRLSRELLARDLNLYSLGHSQPLAYALVRAIDRFLTFTQRWSQRR